MKKNPYLAGLGIILGAALGNIFLYAGLLKHLSPYAFSEAVLAYRLGPPALAGLVAAVLPWLELVAGFFLVLIVSLNVYQAYQLSPVLSGTPDARGAR